MVVIDGDGIVDQAAITGETLPVWVGPGMSLCAGSVLLRGRLVVRASAVGRDTTIGRIINRVEQALTDRAPIQTVGENFSRRFVPTSFALAAATLFITRDLGRAMTMLLIAYPCAVGLAIPTRSGRAGHPHAISAAIGNGARRGILIKGGGTRWPWSETAHPQFTSERNRSQTQQQSSPRQDRRPSRIATAARTSPMTGSIHHQPRVPVRANPPNTAAA